jgi:hypothetical protein
MARGGVRPGSGRPKGAANKFSEAAREQAAAEGITPLEYMLGVLRDDTQTHETRMDAAKASAPYMHARLESVKHSGDALNPLQTITRVERTIIDPAETVADSDAEEVPTAH